MLYDRKRWEPKPVEIPAIEPWRQILIEAAEVIKKRGWTQGDFQDGFDRSVCAIGAFRVVQHGDGNKRHSRNPKYDPADLEAAKRKFWAAIPKSQKVLASDPYGYESRTLRTFSTESIITWNDEVCASKAEIIRYLKAAASWN